jgi:hypothetical protein
VKFHAKYKVDDGYAGGSRPQGFTIDLADIEDDMDDGALEDLFQSAMEEDFQQRVTPYAVNSAEFIAWARQKKGGK